MKKLNLIRIADVKEYIGLLDREEITTSRFAEILNDCANKALTKQEFKYELPPTKEKPVGDGDIRVVNLPVEVLFKHSDKIPVDYDSDTNTVLKYTSGYIMEVIPKQSFIYNNEKSIFIGQTI